ncbi:MAG: hypothetical protein ACK56F_20900, partial [bacterium]
MNHAETTLPHRDTPALPHLRPNTDKADEQHHRRQGRPTGDLPRAHKHQPSHPHQQATVLGLLLRIQLTLPLRSQLAHLLLAQLTRQKGIQPR